MATNIFGSTPVDFHNHSQSLSMMQPMKSYHWKLGQGLDGPSVPRILQGAFLFATATALSFSLFSSFSCCLQVGKQDEKTNVYVDPPVSPSSPSSPSSRSLQVGKQHMKANTYVDFPVELLDMNQYSDVQIPPEAIKEHERRMSRTSKKPTPDKPSNLKNAIRYVNIEAIESNSGLPSTKYKLIGVVNHLGSLNRGHYQAICRSILTNHWYSYDDSKVVPISQDEVLSRDAFIMFYQRLDLLQPVSPLDWVRQINPADLISGLRHHGSRDTMGSQSSNQPDTPVKRRAQGEKSRYSTPRSRFSRSPRHSTPTGSMTLPDFVDALDVVASQTSDIPSETSSASHMHHNLQHTETAL